MEFRFAGYRIQIAKEYIIRKDSLLRLTSLKTDIPSMRPMGRKENIFSGTAIITDSIHTFTGRNP